jgi:RimJ/RimL family protein N-acetyltransferase
VILTLDTPTLDDMLAALEWRKTCLESLRTTHRITAYEQTRFYETVIANGQAPHRYYALRMGRQVVGLVSLEHVQWENRYAEIGLIVDPGYQRKGVGRLAVDLVLEQAFDRMALRTVWGEVYTVNPHVAFWHAVCARHGGVTTLWPRRKYWNGTLYDAVLFSIADEAWRAARAARQEAT